MMTKWGMRTTFWSFLAPKWGMQFFSLHEKMTEPRVICEKILTTHPQKWKYMVKILINQVENFTSSGIK
jgi:hypothetical protein